MRPVAAQDYIIIVSSSDLNKEPEKDFKASYARNRTSEIKDSQTHSGHTKLTAAATLGMNKDKGFNGPNVGWRDTSEVYIFSSSSLR